jgi:ABC-type lipoprotein export system ATPase subunit
MVGVNEYINILLKENDDDNSKLLLYIFSIIDLTIKESFFWALILIENLNLIDNPMYSYIAFGLLALSIPIDNLYRYSKSNFMNKLEKYHYIHCFNKLNIMKKKDILQLDITEYFNNIEIIKENLISQIDKVELFTLMILNSISIIFILNLKHLEYLLPGLILIFIIFHYLSKNIEKSEDINNDKNREIIYYIRNFILNSKGTIINDDFNLNFPTTKIDNITENKKEVTNTIVWNYRILQIIIFVVSILIAMTQFNFSVTTLLFIYEFDTISNKLGTVNYLNHNIKLAQHRINLIENIDIIEEKKINKKIHIYEINIKSLINNVPKLRINREIKIYDKDKIYLYGASGAGKTTFTNIIKGIIEPEELKLLVNDEEMTFKDISSNIFYTIQSDKNIFDANLYDIISNFTKPNVKLIKLALEKALLNNKFDYRDNKFINIKLLSGGESMRLYIAKLFYQITISNRQIVIIDEIDVNLNEDMSMDIHLNLLNIFRDKILIVIAHNSSIKNLFKKSLFVKDSIIYNNYY